MTYVVTELCIGVEGEACMEVCPEHCIFSEPEDEMSYIDPARCTDCGACEAACVVNAIFRDCDVPRASQEFVRVNEEWFRHKTGVRERVKELSAELGDWLVFPS
jgi:NAD-dependent dihydropyrimidine dehydrogenase PreA subunit